MYFPTLDSDTGNLVDLRMTPMRIRKLQLVRPSTADREWLQNRLASVSRHFGCDVEPADDGTLMLQRLVPSRA